MADGELIERSEQQTAIEAAVRAARQGDGRLVVIEGAAGIGKSRLLLELRQVAAHSAAVRVLYARASELERGFAFGVVRQLFESVVRDPEHEAAAYAGAAAAARDVFDETPGDDGVASFALLHGLHWLVLNLAEEGPLVLAIDDLHWCDPSSLRFLAYLARRLEGTPILIGATTRSVTPSSVDAELLADLLTEPTALHLYPQALSEAGAAELLASQLPGPVDPAFAAACFATTDGNPLMLRQLARSLRADGTEPTATNAPGIRRAAYRALSRTVLARVGRYSHQAITLARAVAVLGDDSSSQDVAAVAGLEAPALVDAWGELAGAEILRRESLGFVHALVRDAIYFDLPAPEREALHLHAARTLAGAGAPAERIASQLELAPCTGDPWVVDVTVQAAEAALRRGAPEAAAGHLRRALAEPPVAERRVAVMEALAAAVFDTDARAASELFRELGTLEPDVRKRAGTQIALAQALALTDRWDEASAICRAEATVLGAGHGDLVATLESIRGVAALFGSDDPAALSTLTAHRVCSPDANVGERLRSGLAALLWAFDGGTAADCVQLALTALSEDPTIFRHHTLVAVAPLYLLALADYAGTVDVWDRIRADANRSGSLILHLNLDLWLGITHLRRGHLDEAVLSLTEALVVGASWGTGQEALRYNRATLGHVYLEQGDLGRARATIDAGAPADRSSSLSTLMWWSSEAWLLLAEGRPGDALAATHAAEHRAGWLAAPVGMDWRPARALALHRLGQPAEAAAAARAGVELAERWGAPGAVGLALRVEGELLADDGLEHLARSVAVLEGSSARLELTKSLLALGAATRRGRKPTEAREPLERAYELAGACGSPALVELARAELAATGVRRRATDAAGPGALTPSERRVADLAAGGRSNREIAQELFVTPKTVEVHLSAAYRKLGIASRHALPTVLAGAAG